jgi:hypothetical protein
MPMPATKASGWRRFIRPLDTALRLRFELQLAQNPAFEGVSTTPPYKTLPFKVLGEVQNRESAKK